MSVSAAITSISVEDLMDPVKYIKWRIENQKETVKVGQLVSDFTLSRNVSAKARETFSTLKELSGECVVLFTVPKAFTPTCSSLHLPGFVAAAKKLKELGVTRIACLAVNSPDELWKWSTEHDPENIIFMIPDYVAKWILDMGLAMDKTGERGLGLVAKRSAIILKQGRVSFIGIEEDAGQCKISSAQNILEMLGKELSSKNVASEERKA